MLKGLLSLLFEKDDKQLVTENIYRFIKSVEDKSIDLIKWSLALLGGSFLSIFNDSYLKPTHLFFKLFYLLLIPAWGFLFASIIQGTLIGRIAVSRELQKNKMTTLNLILENLNTKFKNQVTFFFVSLAFFALWLILYLTWWICFYD